MAEARRNWIQWFGLGALCLSACGVVLAQPDRADTPPPNSIQIQSPPSGSLAGRLTDLHSAPLVGVQVVLRNQATGAQAHATTAKNGAFRFASLDAGEYTLEADAPQLGHGRIEEILVTGGTEARVQAAIRFEPPAPALLEAAAPSQIAAPAHAVPMPLASSAPPASAPAAPLMPLMASASPSAALLVPTPLVSIPLLSKPPVPTPAPATPNPPRMTAPPRPSAAVSAPVATHLPPAAPRPAIAAPTPPTTASHPAFSTVSPALTAYIAAEPLRSMPFTALRATDAIPIRPPVQPAALARTLPLPATPASATTLSPRVETVPATRTPAVQPRAELETQSADIQPALALALPRTLPLPAGFAPALSASAEIVSGVQALMQLKLPQLAPILAAVERVDPVTPTVATTVTATQLQALPASGRRWQEFLLDTPAASAVADSDQASFRSSQESAEVTIDGANTRLAFGVAAGSGSGSPASDPSGQGADQQNAMNGPGSQTWTGGRGMGVSEAAIHEVTTVAGNVEAEGLRSAGGRTSIQTESGAGALHGQGFLFDRQNTWGAKNPFTQWVTETAPATLTYNPSGPPLSVPIFDNGPTGVPESYTPPDHEMIWGLGMGSRIRRDKLFWFAALDSYHRNDPGLAMVKHPYLTPTCETPPCSPTGFFATPSDAQMELLCAQLGLTDPSLPGKVCPNPVVEGLTAYSSILEQLASLLGPAPRTAAQWTGFGRIDWQATERHRFTLEGIGADWNSPGGGLTRVSENYGSNSFGSSHASEQLVIARWEAYLTPNLLAVTQGSAGRTILTARPDTPSTVEKGFLNGNFTGQLPEIVVDSRYGFTIGNPSRFGQGSYPDERLYHAQEMLDWVHNRLLVKAGFELDHNADATSLLRNQSGTYVYSKVQDFISDALAFEKFGFADALDPRNPHNCGATDATFGSQPCYSYYSQMMGPTNWHLSTNDWAGYVTAQWQAGKITVFSAGLRWEREQLPPPIAALDNPDLPFTEKLPDLGNNWGPRVSLAIGNIRRRWPVLRLGYGMYYGRVENATVETALTQTGSLKGDLDFFMRPQDDCQYCSGGAPPFPYVFVGEPSSAVKPGVVGFAPNFRNPEVHQGVAAIEQPLPGHVELTAGAMLSLGRRLPVFVDANLGPPVPPNPGPPVNEGITYTVCDEVPYTSPGANSNGGSSNTSGQCGNLGLGPIKAATITVPLYASGPPALWSSTTCPGGSQPNIAGQCGWLNPNYQDIDQITSMANSTYEAAMVKITRYGRRGLSLLAHYTYAHAMDWNPGESPMDPANFKEEYGTSNLDVRHSAAVMVIYEAPWKLRNFAGRIGNGWMLSGIGQFHSGLPYTMRVTGSLPEEFTASDEAIVGLRSGMNGSGGDSRVYGLGNDNNYYNIGRNTYRYPDTWKADLRLGKRFNLGEMRQLELLAESFNLFNHQNVTELETTGYIIDPGSPPSSSGGSATPPTLTFLTGLKTSSTTGLALPAFGQPLNINGTDFYRERQIQFGLRMRF